MNSFKTYQDRINVFLKQQLNSSEAKDSKLKSAMAYSLLSGGKKIRPLLVYATAESVNLDLKVADYIAASIEMIHAYSLIHDDLPAMDDDDLRRGHPTCHIEYDEATAILAGDALQSLAFETLSQIPTDPEIAINLVKSLAEFSGLSGMAGGQSLDLLAEDKLCTLDQLQEIHAKKTGALISAAILMVTACLPTLPLTLQNHYQSFANKFGLSYQIIDDILDVTENSETLGKPAQSDLKNNKSTYPKIVGLEQAQSLAQELINDCLTLLSSLPASTSLKSLTDLIASRNH